MVEKVNLPIVGVIFAFLIITEKYRSSFKIIKRIPFNKFIWYSYKLGHILTEI